MTVDANLQEAFEEVALDVRQRALHINGDAPDLTGLDTTFTEHLMGAVNEVYALALAASGGAINLDGLTDVTITSPSTGHILRFNGTVWVNVSPGTYFDPAGSAAAAQAASQPLDPDLTAIAAVATQAYGRSLLALTNSAGLTAELDDASASTPGVVELATTGEATTGADTVRAVTPAGLKAAIDAAVNALVASAPGTLDTLNEIAEALGDDPNFAASMTTALAGKQPLDASLSSIAGLTVIADRFLYSTGADTFALGTITAAGRALLDDASAADQLTTLGALPAATFGPTNTDYVAVYRAIRDA